MSHSVLILGCGFTGALLARRLLERGLEPVLTTRHPDGLRPLADRGARILTLDAGRAEDLAALRAATPRHALVVHSVPLLDSGGEYRDPTPALLEALGSRPARMVYLSTTGVYGAAREVDETTPPAPRTPRERLRLDAERAVAAGPWESLILRPAAIYGPGRGVHDAMRRGEFRLRGEGANWISRIHAEDLAAHAEAALFRGVTGAFPVADDHPCPSREIAAYCAGLLSVPLPPPASDRELSETRRADRKVDGSAIRRLLGIELLYPSYLTGIPACLEKEGRAGAIL